MWSNLQPPDDQSDSHLTEPQESQKLSQMYPIPLKKIRHYNSFLYLSVKLEKVCLTILWCTLL